MFLLLIILNKYTIYDPQKGKKLKTNYYNPDGTVKEVVNH